MYVDSGVLERAAYDLNFVRRKAKGLLVAVGVSIVSVESTRAITHRVFFPGWSGERAA